MAEQGVPGSSPIRFFRTSCFLTACVAVTPLQAAEPSVPGGFRAAIYSRTAAELFWDRSSDDGYVRGYYLTRNDTPLGERDALSLFESDLAPGVRYRYTIAAVDNDGNRSPPVTIELISGEGVVGNVGGSGTALPAPANLWAEIYSVSAIELFWDRADTPGLQYEVSLDGVPIGDTDGTSYFVDGLTDTPPYDFSVQAFDPSGSTSAPSSVSLTTSGLHDPVDNPLDSSDVLQNVRLDVYSDNATELFWDRPPPDEGIVSVEVIRNGVSIGTTFGNSFYDDTRAPNSNQIYRLVAIDTDGNRYNAADTGQFEFQKLDTGAGQSAFGDYGHVAVAGDTAVLPADRELMAGSDRYGAVYVFTRDAAGQWQRTQKLVAEEGGGGFGLSVAIDGNTLAVGQRFIPASDGVRENRGGVTVYSRNANGQWGDARSLVVDTADRVYRIGNAIAIDGNTMMIGATNDFDSAPVFVFERDAAGQWIQTQSLSLEDEDSGLGSAIAIDGDTAVLGDYRDPTHGFISGAAWIFTRAEDGRWSRGPRLLPSTGEEQDQFGNSVGLEGDTAVIGGDRSTRAHVFTRRDDGQWPETQVLEFKQDKFGYQGTGNFVDLDGDTLVVGTRNASWLGYVTGAVQVFRKSGDTWYEYGLLGSSDGQRQQDFGEAVAIDGDTVVTGARLGPLDRYPTGTTAYVHVLD